MRMTRVGLVCLLLSSLTLVNSAIAQDPFIGGAGSSTLSDAGIFESTQDISGTVSLGNNGSYLFLNKMVGDQPGAPDGFWNFGLWTELFEFEGDFLLFGDIRAMVTDNKRIGYNAGLGTRINVRDLNGVFGTYVYYDDDESKLGNEYQQVTVGADWRSDFLQILANGYILVDENEKNIVTNLPMPGPQVPVFKGNTIVVEGMRLVEQAVGGADVEVGVPVGPLHWLKAFAGVFYYDSKTPGDDSLGVKGRLVANVSDETTIIGSIYDDDQFGTNYQLAVAMQFSGGGRPRMFPKFSNYERMRRRVDRNWRIATTQFKETFDTPFINPNTGLPFGPGSIVFVQAGGSGDGSFGSPSGPVNGALPGAVIIVVLRDAADGTPTSIADPLFSQFNLLPGQELLGEGLPHTFAGGAITFPGLATSGRLPFVTAAPGQDIVTLANGNFVNGLNLLPPVGGNAIVGANIKNFNIQNIGNDLTLGDPPVAGGGIVLNNATGMGELANIRFNIGDPTANGPLTIANSGAGVLNLDVDTFAFANGGRVGLGMTASNNAVINAQVESYLASGNGSGLMLTSNSGGSIDIGVEDSTFDNATGLAGTTGNGVSLVGNNGLLNVALTNTTANDAAGHGFHVGLMNNARFTGKVNGGSFINAGSDPGNPNGTGLNIVLDDTMRAFNGTIPSTLSVIGNTAMDPVRFDNARDDAFFANLTTNSNMNVTIQNGSFMGAGDNAFDANVDSGSTLNLDVDPTPGSGAAAEAFLFNVAGGSTLNASFIDGNLSMAGLDGVLGTVTDPGSSANLLFDNTPINGSGQTGVGDGLDFTVTNFGALDVDFSNNLSMLGTNGNINDAANDGIRGTFNSNAVVDIDLDSTPIIGSGIRGGFGNAFNFDVDTAAVLNFGFDNASASGSQDNGLLADIDNVNTVANFTFNGATIDNSGIPAAGVRDGANVMVSDNARTSLIMVNSSVSGSRDNGIVIGADTNAFANLQTNGTTVDNSMAGDGLNFDIRSGARLTTSLTGGSFSGSGDNAFDGNVQDPGSTATVNINGTMANNSGGIGADLNAFNMGRLDFTMANGSISNSNNSGTELTVMDPGTIVNLAFQNSNLDGNGTGGMGSGASIAVMNDADVNAEFTGGSVSNNLDFGLLTTVDGAGTTLDTSIVGTQIDFNGLASPGVRHGISSTITNGADATLILNGASASTNRNDGLFADVDGAGSTIDIEMNTASLNTNVNGDGFRFDVTGGALLTTNNGITGGTASGNGNNAFDGNVVGAGSQAVLNIDGLTANMSGADGFLFNVNTAGRLDLTFNGTNNPGSVSQSQETGVRSIIDGAMTVANFTYNNVNINDNGQSGLGHGTNLMATNGAAVTSSWTGGSASGNNQLGMMHTINTGSTMMFTSSATQINNNGATGFGIDIDGAGSTGTYSLTDTNIDGSGLNGTGDGLNVDVTNQAAFTFSALRGSISGSQDNGVIGNVDGAGSTGTFSFDSTVINNSGLIAGMGDGVNLSGTAGATLGLDMIAGSVSNNRDRGIVFDIDGAGTTGTLSIDVDAALTGTQANGNRNGDGLFFDVTSGANLMAGITGASFSNNGVDAPANGVRGNVDGVGTIANVTIDSTTASNNRGDLFSPTGDGFGLDVSGGAELNVAVNNGSRAENNSNSGLRFTAIDIGTNASLTMNGSNVFTGNGNMPGHLGNVSMRDGIDIDATNINQMTVTVSGTISGNGGAGVDVNLNNVTAVNDLVIDSLTVTGNGGNGVSIVATDTPLNNGTVTNNFIQGNNTAGMVGAGLQINLTRSPAPDFVIGDNTQIDGVSIQLDESQMDSLVIDSNTITGNSTGDGIGFNINNSNVSGAIVDNSITGNSGNGIGVTTSADAAFVAGNGGNPMLVDFRSMVTNRLTGEMVNGIGAGVDANSMGNTISNNTNGSGIFTDLPVNTRMVADITSNTIASNSSFGVNVTATDGSFDVAVGGVTTDPQTGAFLDRNIITGNVGAGVAFLGQDTSGADPANPNTIRVQNNVIHSTTANANTTDSYIGDGVHLQLTTTNININATSVFTNPIIDGNFIGTDENMTAGLGNSGRGTTVNLQDDTQISDFDFTNNVVINNSGTGFQLLRLDDSVLSDLLDVNADPMAGPLTRAVTITDNMFNANGANNNNPVVPAPESVPNTGDGIDLVTRNGSLTLNDFEIDRNQITNNINRGVHMEVGADARLLADIEDNDISNNASHGLHMTEEQNDPTDQRVISGTWIKNNISNNGGHGIRSQAVTGGVNPLSIGLNGTDPADGKNRGNMILNNALDGIQIDDSSDTSNNVVLIPENAQNANMFITNNEISFNGTGGIDVNTFRMNKSQTLTNNIISNNNGDGFEIITSVSNAFVRANNVTALGNTIKLNNGRGVDILNRGDASVSIKFGDGTLPGMNDVLENNEEGFYVVNTSSLNEMQDNLAPAYTALLADGLLDEIPDLTLNIDTNRIQANGKDSPLEGSGIVMRVGTANGDLNSPTAVINGVGTEAGGAGVGNGRVNANIINNTFEGNFGLDVLTESYVSTVDPPVTGGVWDDMMFMVNGGYRADPLSRLNLVFAGNNGNSMDMTRIGASYTGPPEPVFKSRLINPTAPPRPIGIFQNGARARVAQRIAARHEDVNFNGVLDAGEDTNGNGLVDGMNPNTGADNFGPDGSGVFLYSGMGISTFRIAGGFDVVDGIPNNGMNFTSGLGFLLDAPQVPDFTFGTTRAASQVPANGIFRAGEGPDAMPYGWGPWIPDNGVTSFPDPFQGPLPFQPMP